MCNPIRFDFRLSKLILDLSSLLLFLATTALLFLLSSGASYFGCFHQLQYGALLLLSFLNLHSSPHLVNLSLLVVLCLFLHAHLLITCLSLQVKPLEGVVLAAHRLALHPLLQTITVILRLIPAEQVLNDSNLDENSNKFRGNAVAVREKL